MINRMIYDFLRHQKYKLSAITFLEEATIVNVSRHYCFWMWSHLIHSPLLCQRFDMMQECTIHLVEVVRQWARYNSIAVSTASTQTTGEFNGGPTSQNHAESNRIDSEVTQVCRQVDACWNAHPGVCLRSRVWPSHFLVSHRIWFRRNVESCIR